MNEEWERFSHKLDSLKTENRENRLSTLHEILNDITVTYDWEIKKRLLTSPDLYECLEIDDEEDFYDDDDDDRISRPEEVVADILEVCLKGVSSDHEDFIILLKKSLLHKEPVIRAVALTTILQQLKEKLKEGLSLASVVSEELVQYALLALQDEELTVGSPAADILVMVWEDHLEEPNFKESLLAALKTNEIIKCRLYGMAVKFGKRSAAALEKVEFILDDALSELDNDDDEMHLSILEIFVELSKQDQGILYLEKRHVIDVISKRIEDIDQNRDELLIPPILSFFTRIASAHPQRVISNYPQMTQYLFECLDSNESDTLTAAFDSFVNLTLTPELVQLMEEHYSSSICEAFAHIATCLPHLAAYLKSIVLVALKHIFKFEPEDRDQISDIMERWFKYLSKGSNDMKFLEHYCKHQTPDIMTCTLELINFLCGFRWGIEALKNTAGFLEYLLDRNVNSNNDVKYSKYFIIKTLANSDAFDVRTSIQLRTYVNEGPYYIRRAVQVAVEGNE